MLPRKLVRSFFRVAVALSLISAVVFVSDLWYDFLPSALQTKLPLHSPDPVIVDVKIETCGPFTTCPSSNFPWKRNPKDLYLSKSWFRHSYVYTMEMPENELPRGQDVVLALAHTSNKDLPVEIEEEIEVSPLTASNDKEKARLLGWQFKGHGLWVKYGKHVPGKAVTEIKVFYGASAWYGLPGWHLCKNKLRIGREDPRIAFLVGRPQPLPEVPQLSFDKNGKLKIVQFNDLHMSTGWGVCDYPEPETPKGEVCYADMQTLHLMEDVLFEENPDLVVFDGDQIFGDRSPDPETSLLKALSPVLERKLPFALVLGNHDDTKQMNRAEYMSVVEQMPYFVGEQGPPEVPGVGNYVVTAQSGGYPALAMYFLDSHSKTDPVIPESIYDWIKPEQHEFLRRKATDVQARLKGYPRIPLAMSFFHIPLPEFREDILEEGGDSLVRVGDRREWVIAPIFNSGTMDVLREIDVSIVSVGHDHTNDYCQLRPPPDQGKNVWMCYGGGGGVGGYGAFSGNEGKNYERRARIYEIDANAPFIDTWQRVQNHEERVNEVRLVDNGQAVYISATN